MLQLGIDSTHLNPALRSIKVTIMFAASYHRSATVNDIDDIDRAALYLSRMSGLEDSYSPKIFDSIHARKSTRIDSSDSIPELCPTSPTLSVVLQ